MAVGQDRPSDERNYTECLATVCSIMKTPKKRLAGNPFKTRQRFLNVRPETESMEKRRECCILIEVARRRQSWENRSEACS